MNKDDYFKALQMCRCAIKETTRLLDFSSYDFTVCYRAALNTEAV